MIIVIPCRRRVSHILILNLFRFVDQRIKLVLLNRHCLIKPVHPHWTGTNTVISAPLHFLLLSERINLLVVEVLEVLVTYLAQLFVPLEQQVVGRRHVVVLVRIDALHRIVLLEVVLH